MDYGSRELALKLRVRQREIQEAIRAEDPTKGLGARLHYLCRAKAHTDQILADLAEELSLPDNFHKTLDREIESRRDASRTWGV